MTQPREVIPGRRHMVTRRCTQRQYLMRPDDETNEAFEYCLAVAAKRYGIRLLFTIAMSNHHHTGIEDVHGNYPEFLEYFHRLFANCQNALRGRTENFWSSEQTSVVRLVDLDDVLEKLVYALTNPVAAHLVERAEDWPGVSSLNYPRPKAVNRPKAFFRENGIMPESVELHFEPPGGEAHLSAVTWAALVEHRIRAAETVAAQERLQRRQTVVGRRGVLAQDWRGSPRTKETAGELNPRVAARSKWRRIEALLRRREFLVEYRRAWHLLQARCIRIPFPRGTYWMRRFMGVVCADGGSQWSLDPPLPCVLT